VIERERSAGRKLLSRSSPTESSPKLAAISRFNVQRPNVQHTYLLVRALASISIQKPMRGSVLSTQVLSKRATLLIEDQWLRFALILARPEPPPPDY